MPSQPEHVRPGIRLGSYPQREESERRFSERLANSLYTPLQKLRERRNLSLQAVTQRVDAAAKGLPRFGGRQWREYKTNLQRRLSSEGLQTDLIAQAFALVRQAAENTLGMRHHNVQLMAAWAMVDGYLVEMGTGEGKSLTATLAASCAALAGIPVHLITTNEYLAARDASEMKPLYQALGLSCAEVDQQMGVEQRRAAYSADIAYCTNKQVAFDYLRDRLVMRNETSSLALKLRQFDPESGPVLRGLCFAIVDEADSVMIDEACTPLLLSREMADPERELLYRQALAIAARLQEGQHFRLDRKTMQARLSADGKQKLAELCAAQRLSGVWQGPRRREWLLQQALQALHLYKADEQYLVRDGCVEIIDPNTGRTMPDRAWQQGMHQMVECKEDCELTGQRETLARISYQRFFLRYLHLSGMSGTLNEVSGELQAVYNLPVLRIPPNKARQAVDMGCQLHRNTKQKYQAIIERVKQIHASGQPLLLGTTSLASSEELSALLNKAGLAHMVLNARQDAEEAQIIAGAGLRKAITVATNMAGRGTDIKLGRGVAKLGGLHVIACEPNQSRRIDRQLFGRCGRQGEPGSYELFLALDDELVSTYSATRTLGERALKTSRLEFVAPLLASMPQRSMQNRLKAQRRQVLAADQQMDDLLAFSGNSE